MTDAAKMRQMLVRRFDESAWALLFEVKASVGHNARRADALAISCWKSRGLHIHGVEIKVHRSDWLRELSQPGKSADVQRYCHFWWIAAPKGVVQRDELPETWGLLEPQKGGKLVASRKAPKLELDPPNMAFISELGRRMTKVVSKAKSLVRSEIVAEQNEDQRLQDEYQRGLLDGAPKLRDAHNKLQLLQQRLATFEQESGIKIDDWGIGDIGRAARLIADQRVVHYDSIEHLVNQLEHTLRSVRGVQQALREFRGKSPAKGAEGA